jgi:hypothetical protein
VAKANLLALTRPAIQKPLFSPHQSLLRLRQRLTIYERDFLEIEIDRVRSRFGA